MDISKDEVYSVDTLKWTKFWFHVIGELKSFTLYNPTARSVGTLLLLELVTGTSAKVTVKFGDDYNIVGNIIIPGGKTVTGILLLDEGGKRIPFSLWNCEGRPLLSPMT